MGLGPFAAHAGKFPCLRGLRLSTSVSLDISVPSLQCRNLSERGAIGQGDQISRLFHEDDQISPLFHEGAQDVQLINLSILPPWVAGFRAAETKLVSRRLIFGAGP